MKFGAHIFATVMVATFLTSSLHAAEPKHAKPNGAKAAKLGSTSHQAVLTATERKPVHPYPRTELFLGYSYLRAVPSFADDNRLVHLNGGNASVAFNLTRSFGLVTDFTGFADSQVARSGPGANSVGIADSKGDAVTFLFGPRFSYRRSERLVPFFQVLAGGVHASEVTLKDCTGSSCQELPAQSSFALAAGGGLDLKLRKHLAIRLLQAEYMMTRLADTTTGYSATQNDLRLSAGLVFRFGGAKAEHHDHQPVVSCSSDAASQSAEGIAIHAQASDADGDPLTYNWSSSKGYVEGKGADVRWLPAGASPGSYTVSLVVDDGHFRMAGCTTNVYVDALPNHPPTLTCVADHANINAGDPLTITAVEADSDIDPLTLIWGTSGGRIVGSGTSVNLDTAGLPSGSIAVQGHVFDGRGGVADCSMSINIEGVLPPALIVTEKRLALHSIYFATAEPTIEHPNAGIVASQQTTLQLLAKDFKLYLVARPNAQLIFEGHADPRASQAYNLALTQRRVDSAKRYLVELGVPSERITVRPLGDKQGLSPDQVRTAVTQNPELSDSQRQKMLDNIQTILLASNRRVDITLQNSSRLSSREYPFNAEDSLTLLSRDQPQERQHRGVETKQKAQ